MRLRVVLLLSLTLNLALAAILYFKLRGKNAEAPPVSNAFASAAASSNAKTNIVVRRQFFTWQEIESDNFQTYIANLRSIGCPEPTIRDIILAEIDLMFEQRRALEIVTPAQQWWRSDPDPQIAQTAQSKLAALDLERRTLLNDLLGPNWDAVTAEELLTYNIQLDGPILGKLSPDAKQAIRNIAARVQQRNESLGIQQSAASYTLTSADEGKFRQEIRSELAKVLNSEQLEEFLLRYSNNAYRLRNELRGQDTTPDEFRKLFRAYDEIDKQLISYIGGTDSVSVARQNELEIQRENAIKQVLGNDRYTLFKFNQDPLFRQSQTLAQTVGAPPETVLSLYQIQQATELERARIQNDGNLSLEERAAALASMLAEQQESLRRVLGDQAYEAYIRFQTP